MRQWHTKIESASWHCSFFTDADGVLEKVSFQEGFLLGVLGALFSVQGRV